MKILPLLTSFQSLPFIFAVIAALERIHADTHGGKKKQQQQHQQQQLKDIKRRKRHRRSGRREGEREISQYPEYGET